ncbi:MAG: Mov34/MPN/PAD-1 family protein [Gammaproteobacteria bacterium]|nr:Mov34/MPN/PAD-1 family protein [Gammaproteobacteria bacterium]
MNDKKMNCQNLWIPKSIFDAMVEEAEKKKPLETGGAFMGYVADNHDVIITDMIDAGVNAIHKKISFTPDQEYQLKEMEDIYYNSEGMTNYLGDWHTHPNGTTNLSLKDKKTLTRIGITPESQNSYPIMVILASQPSEWTMSAVQFVSGYICLRAFVVCKYKQLLHTFY